MPSRRADRWPPAAGARRGESHRSGDSPDETNHSKETRLIFHVRRVYTQTARFTGNGER